MAHNKTSAGVLTWGTIPRSVPSILQDLPIIFAGFALFYALLSMTHYWMAPANAGTAIQLRVSALPKYAMFSVLRIAIAYLFSLAFTLVYGYIAAYNARAEKFMIPLLDTLQSIPVLSFLPGVMLSMVALFPTRQLGVELGSILLIFTGQVWNMTFSFYSSLKNIPREMREVAQVYRWSWWQRFTQMELPYAAIGLVWNSMMSVAGGWFFLMACEMFILGNRRSAASRPGLVFANGGERRRYAGNRLGSQRDDRNHRADRSADLASCNRLVGEIQIRTSRIRGIAAFVCPGFPAALEDSAFSGAGSRKTCARVFEFIFCKQASRGRREPKARRDWQVDLASSFGRDASRRGLRIREDDYFTGGAYPCGIARHFRGSRRNTSSSGVYFGAGGAVDNSGRSDCGSKTETFGDCATARADCRVGAGHGAISDYLARAHQSRRQAWVSGPSSCCFWERSGTSYLM